MSNQRPKPDLLWGPWLTVQMNHKGFETNKDLERATGIDNTVISRWRNGETVPRAEQLRKLEKPLGVPLLELLVRAGHISAAEAGGALPAREDQIDETPATQPVGLGLDAAADGLTPEELEPVLAVVRAIKRAKGLDV